MTKPPEKSVNTDGGRLISAVLTLSTSVKTMIEAISEPAIMYGRFLSLSSLVKEPPTMTGNNGSTQGAGTVRIPLINGISSNSI